MFTIAHYGEHERKRAEQAQPRSPYRFVMPGARAVEGLERVVQEADDE